MSEKGFEGLLSGLKTLSYVTSESKKRLWHWASVNDSWAVYIV